MDDSNRVRMLQLITAGRIPDAVVPTYLVARWQLPDGGGDGRWAWDNGPDGRPRVWMTVRAAEEMAKLHVVDDDQGGPAVVLHADRVPPPPAADMAAVGVPHCRVVRLYELGENRHAAAAADLPGLDKLIGLVHDLYLPAGGMERKEVSGDQPAPPTAG